MRLPSWSLLPLIACCLWSPSTCPRDVTRLVASAEPRRLLAPAAIFGKRPRGTVGDHSGDEDAVCPSQCQVRRKGTLALACRHAEQVHLLQLARCLLSLRAVAFLDLVYQHFSCNCTFKEFVVLTSFTNIVTVSSTYGCSPWLLIQCGSAIGNAEEEEAKGVTVPDESQSLRLRVQQSLMGSRRLWHSSASWRQRIVMGIPHTVVRMQRQKLPLVSVQNLSGHYTARKTIREELRHSSQQNVVNIGERPSLGQNLHSRKKIQTKKNISIRQKDSGQSMNRALTKPGTTTDHTSTAYNEKHYRKRFRRKVDIPMNSTRQPSQTSIYSYVIDHQSIQTPTVDDINEQEMIARTNRSPVLGKLGADHLLHNFSRSQSMRMVQELGRKEEGQVLYTSSKNDTDKILHKRSKKKKDKIWRKLSSQESEKLLHEISKEEAAEKWHKLSKQADQISFDPSRTEADQTLKKPQQSHSKPVQKSITLENSIHRTTDHSLHTNEKEPPSTGKDAKRMQRFLKKMSDRLEKRRAKVRTVKRKSFSKHVGKREQEGSDGLFDKAPRTSDSVRLIAVSSYFDKPTPRRILANRKRNNYRKLTRAVWATRKNEHEDKQSTIFKVVDNSLQDRKQTSTYKTYSKESSKGKLFERVKRQIEEDTDTKVGDTSNNNADSKDDDSDNDEEEEDENEEDGGFDNDADYATGRKNENTSRKRQNIDRKIKAAKKGVPNLRDTFTISPKLLNDFYDEKLSNTEDTYQDYDSFLGNEGGIFAIKKETDHAKPSLFNAQPSLPSKLSAHVKTQTDDKRKKNLSTSEEIKANNKKKSKTKIKQEQNVLNNWEKILEQIGDPENLHVLTRLQDVHQFADSPDIEEEVVPFIDDYSVIGLQLHDLSESRLEASRDLPEMHFPTSEINVPLIVNGTLKKKKRDAKTDAKKEEKKEEKTKVKKEKGKKVKKEETKPEISKDSKAAEEKKKEGEKEQKTEIKMQGVGKGNKNEEEEDTAVKVTQSKEGTEVVEVKHHSDKQIAGSKEDDHSMRTLGMESKFGDGFSTAVTAMMDIVAGLFGILVVLIVVCCCFCCRKKQTPGRRRDESLVQKLLLCCRLVKPPEDKEKLLGQDQKPMSPLEMKKLSPVNMQDKLPPLLVIEPVVDLNHPEDANKPEQSEFLRRLTKQRLSIFQAPVEEEEPEAELTTEGANTQASSHLSPTSSSSQTSISSATADSVTSKTTDKEATSNDDRKSAKGKKSKSTKGKKSKSSKGKKSKDS